MMLSVVCWKWGEKFSAEHVNALARGFAANYHAEHRFYCITDESIGSDRENYSPDIRLYDLGLFERRYPVEARKCKGRNFRKLQILSEGMRPWLGDRILQLDLDVLIVGDVTPLFYRPDPIVISRSISQAKRGWSFNTGLMLINTGLMDRVWEWWKHDPQSLLDAAERAGWGACPSDESIVSFALSEHTPVWTDADGVYAWREHRDGLLNGPPANARLIHFYGEWDHLPANFQNRVPWVREAWDGGVPV